MNHEDRQLLNAKIAELMHWAFVVIRNATYGPPNDAQDRTEEINDLADLLHNLPRYIVGHDEYAVSSFDWLRAEVVKHVRRFHPGLDPNNHRYVSLLDMDAEQFLSRYRDHHWPEPVAAH